jgi:hypothetical protein
MSGNKGELPAPSPLAPTVGDSLGSQDVGHNLCD